MPTETQIRKQNSFLNSVEKFKYELFALCVLLIYLSPNIFVPHKAKYLIHDNLDSNVVWYKNLAESGKMFSSNQEIVPNSLGGIPRGCYPSEWNIMHLLYLIFSPLVAYNINIVLMHIAAFLGMLLLLKNYFRADGNGIFSVTIALLFSLLPFWPSGGLAIAGQPLLLYALLNVYYSKDKISDWIIVFFIPFYSLFALSGLFFIVTICLGLLIDTFIKRRINLKVCLAIILFISATIIAENRLFYMQFVEHFESHRDNVEILGTLNFKGLVGVSLLHLFKGQYHFHSLHTPIVTLVIFIGIFYGQQSQKLRILGLLVLLYVFSFLLVLPGWSGLETYFHKVEMLKKVTLRFYSLFPLIWFIVLAYTVKIIFERSQQVVITLTFSLLIVQMIFQVFSINSVDYQGCNFSENTFYRTYINSKSDEYDTFSNYYKPDLFSRIKNELDHKAYTACIDFNPEIAQYNGINTIDGYFYYYPMKMRRLMDRINQQVNKNAVNVEHSNRCWLSIPKVQIGDSCLIDPKWDFELLDSLSVGNFISKHRIISNELSLIARIEDQKQNYYIYSNNFNKVK